jgi:hypothetical protein
VVLAVLQGVITLCVTTNWAGGGALSADVQSNTFVAFSLSFKLNSEVRKFVISLPW